MDSTTHDLSHVLIELGLVVIGLAILARIASRWGFSAIPLYLLAGLAFGNGGLAPLKVSAGFIHIGAEIGVLLLLFMLGVEYTGRELVDNLRDGFPAAVVDVALNFTPGLIAGLFLRWRPLPAVLLGGVTYVSSSGVIAKVLADLRRLANPETPLIAPLKRPRVFTATESLSSYGITRFERKVLTCNFTVKDPVLAVRAHT